MKTKMVTLLLAGLALLAACKGGGFSATTDSTRVINNNDKTSKAIGDSVPGAAKLVKTGEIKFKVNNVQQTSEAIAALTVKYGGMVMHHDMTSHIAQSRDVQSANDSVRHISVFNTEAEMTVKIPSDKLEDFMNQVNHMSLYVNDRKMNIEDLTIPYLTTQLKLQSRKQLINQQQAGTVIIKNPANVMQLKDDIIDGQMNNRNIDEAVKFSMVNLNLYQSNTVIKETIANDDLNAYNQPAFQRIGFAIANGWNIFAEIVIGLINAWVFILMGIGAYLGYRLYKRKNAQIKPSAV